MLTLGRVVMKLVGGRLASLPERLTRTLRTFGGRVRREHSHKLFIYSFREITNNKFPSETMYFNYPDNNKNLKYNWLNVSDKNYALLSALPNEDNCLNLIFMYSV